MMMGMNQFLFESVDLWLHLQAVVTAVGGAAATQVEVKLLAEAGEVGVELIREILKLLVLAFQPVHLSLWKY